MNNQERIVMFFSSSYKAAIELLFYSFIWLGIAYYSLDFFGIIGWLFLLVGGYSLFPIIFRKTHSYFKVSVFIALFTSVSNVFLNALNQLNALEIVMLSLFTVLFLISGFRRHRIGFTNSFSMPFMALSIGGHLVLQVLKTVWLVELQAINITFNVLGIVSVIAMLFILNERMLASEQYLLGKTTVMKKAVQLNRLILSGLSFIVIFIVLFRSWQEKIEQYITSFFNWLMSLNKSEEAANEQPRIDDMLAPLPFGEGEVEEPSVLAQIIEAILMYIAYGIVVIVLLVLLFMIGRVVSKLLSKLIRFLKLRVDLQSEENVAFVDNVEDIIQTKSDKNRLFSKKTKRVEKKWKTLSTQQKCMYLYTFFIKQVEQIGHKYKKAYTVQEQVNYITKHYNLSLHEEQLGNLVHMYEQVKYGFADDSSISLTNQQLDELYDAFSKIK